MYRAYTTLDVWCLCLTCDCNNQANAFKGINDTLAPSVSLFCRHTAFCRATLHWASVTCKGPPLVLQSGNLFLVHTFFLVFMVNGKPILVKLQPRLSSCNYPDRLVSLISSRHGCRPPVLAYSSLSWSNRTW